MPRTRSIAWSELKLGLLGVVALALTSALVFAVGGQGGFFWQRYPLKARFDDVQGLKAGAIVRLNGMEVGKVTEVAFSGAQVEVVLEVSRNVRPLITDRSEAAMGTLSLLGEPIVVIRAAESGTPLADGAYLRVGGGSGMAELAASTARSAGEAGRLLADVRAGKGSVGHLFAEDALYHDMEALTSAAARVAERLDTGGGTLGALSADPAAYQALLGALRNLEAFTAGLGRGQGSLGVLATDDALARSLARASANLEALTGSLGRGEGTAGRLLTDAALYERVNALTERLDRLVAQLEGGGGSAGQLLTDARLYENLNGAASELRELVSDVRQNPRKYLSVRVGLF